MATFFYFATREGHCDACGARLVVKGDRTEVERFVGVLRRFRAAHATCLPKTSPPPPPKGPSIVEDLFASFFEGAERLRERRS